MQNIRTSAEDRTHEYSQLKQESVFELQDVSYGYGAADVLRRVQLHIPAHRTILITGPNGSGKTTLLKLLAGVLAPCRGTIRRYIQPGEMASLGHETYIYPGLTVAENVRFWLRLHHKTSTEAYVEQILHRVGLKAMLYEPAAHLSRGMAQRLSLARVVSLGPTVLLLDEPTAGLDSASQAMMRHEVSRVRERGATVLWITHAPEAEMQMADSILQVSGGNVHMDMCAGKYM
ncbi:MAG: ABC transporter ATP-binding protein [Desulfovermiculus sp.]